MKITIPPCEGARRLFLSSVLLVAAMAAVPLSPTHAQTSSTGPAPYSPSPAQLPGRSYLSSWIGNYGSGLKGQNAQNFCDSIYVTSDGTVFTNTFYDEAHNEVSAYKNGIKIGIATDTAGSGGIVVGSNGSYLFLGQVWTDSSTTPATIRYGITRRSLSDVAGGYSFVPWASGSAATLANSFLDVNDTTTGSALSNYFQLSVAGLAATPASATDPSVDRLYLSYRSPDGQGHIAAYNPNTYNPTGNSSPLLTWAVDRPGALVYDSQAGRLWMVQKGDSSVTPAIAPTLQCYDSSGNTTNTITLPTGTIPQGLAMDASGHLLVTDTGASKQVLIYSGIYGTPAQTTFGQAGGVNAATSALPPGQMAPDRFISPIGVGTDAQGNLYVAEAAGNGTFRLQGFTPGHQPAWVVQTTTFSDTADVDPASETDLFGGTTHYKVDYSQNVGHEWSFYGYTLDPDRYPQDARVNAGNSAGSRVVYLPDPSGVPHKFLMYYTATGIGFYRFESGKETAIPCVFISSGSRDYALGGSTWPPNHPTAAYSAGTQPIPGHDNTPYGDSTHFENHENWWIWRDRPPVNDPNGTPDGNFDASEFSRPSSGTASDDSFLGAKWIVDKNGDLWALDTGGPMFGQPQRLVHFAFHGLDAFGAPIYDAKDASGTPTDYISDGQARTGAFVERRDLPAPFYTADPNNPGSAQIVNGAIVNMAYDSGMDRLYLVGHQATYGQGTTYLNGNPNSIDFGIYNGGNTGAPLLACWSNWTNSSTAQLQWVAPLPHPFPGDNGSNGGDDNHALLAKVSAAGSYVFFGHYSGRVFIYSADTGYPLNQTLVPDLATIAPGPGFLDAPNSVNAFRRSNGEYVVLTEGDFAAKNLMYRWQPPAVQIVGGGNGDPSFYEGTFQPDTAFLNQGSRAGDLATPIDTVGYDFLNQWGSFPLDPFEQVSRLNFDFTRSDAISFGPPNLYGLERRGAPNVSYSFPGLKPFAWYKVALHFNENFWGVYNTGRTTYSGIRLADIYLNNKQVANQFDFWARAGASNTAHIEEFMAPADASGNLALVMSPSANTYDAPKVEGVEILPAVSETFQIAAGNTSPSGVGVFTSDRDFTGGTIGATGTTTDTSGVVNPAPSGVYSSYRTGAFTYKFPSLLPGGSYVLRLHMNEPSVTTAGARAMDITVNGGPAVAKSGRSSTDYDIYTITGGTNKAVVEEVLATADNEGVVTVSFAQDPSASNPPIVSGLELLPSLDAVYQIAAGYYIGTNQKTPDQLGAFVTDTLYDDGRISYAAEQGNLYPFIVTENVPNAAPKAVYFTARTPSNTDPTGGASFSYTLPKLIPTNTYIVRLHFVESALGAQAPLQRVMNVTANGQALLTNFDIFNEVGGNKACVHQFLVTPDSSGRIVLNFANAGYRYPPSVCGIEVLRTTPAVASSVDAGAPVTTQPVAGQPVSTTTDSLHRRKTKN